MTQSVQAHNCKLLVDRIEFTSYRSISSETSYSKINHQPAETLSSELLQNQKDVKKNRFTTARDLWDYKSYLNFASFLYGLLPSQRWLDAGAGRARAQIDLLKELGDESPEMIALTASRPWFVLPIFSRKYKRMDGRLIEEISNTELGKFNLITDLFGPFSYAKDPIAIINKYVKLLETGGRAYVYSSSMSNHVSISKYGQQLETINLSDWLRNEINKIPGLEFVKIDHDTFYILKTHEESEQKLPSINLIRFVSDKPPYRIFEQARD